MSQCSCGSCHSQKVPSFGRSLHQEPSWFHESRRAARAVPVPRPTYEGVRSDVSNKTARQTLAPWLSQSRRDTCRQHSNKRARRLAFVRFAPSLQQRLPRWRCHPLRCQTLDASRRQTFLAPRLPLLAGWRQWSQWCERRLWFECCNEGTR